MSWHYYDNNKFSLTYERLVCLFLNFFKIFFRGRGVDHTVVVYDMNRGAKNTRDIQSTTFEANVSEKIYGISWFK